MSTRSLHPENEQPREIGPPGAELIAAERRRQIEAEGWTPEHDAEHADGELLHAARCYEVHADFQLGDADPDIKAMFLAEPARIWPWELSAWKPSDDPIRNLVKAGALIAAEIDRLQRRR